MNQEEKINYLNQIINDKNAKYSGPKSLFKYRPFDKYSFDMLENEYMYLCPAKNEDDKTECVTTVDLGRLIEVETNNLKRECVEQIIQFLKPYMDSDRYEVCRSKIYSIMDRRGNVSPHFMLDLSHELQEMLPKEYNIAPLVNWIINIPNKLNDPEISSQIKPLISIAYNAREVIGLCSLAECNDIYDMWKEYAADSSGYCIEYDVSEYELNKDILPVIYDDNRKTNIIIQLVGSFIGQMIIGMSNGQIYADATQFIRLFLSKNTEWEYQKEWRLIGKVGETPLAPKIKCIYLGKNIEEVNEKSIREFANSKGTRIEKMY